MRLAAEARAAGSITSSRSRSIAGLDDASLVRRATIRRFSGRSRSRSVVMQMNTSSCPRPDDQAVRVSDQMMGPRTWPTQRSAPVRCPIPSDRTSEGSESRNAPASGLSSTAAAVTADASEASQPVRALSAAAWSVPGSSNCQSACVDPADPSVMRRGSCREDRSGNAGPPPAPDHRDAPRRSGTGRFRPGRPAHPAAAGSTHRRPRTAPANG